ncbi:MAG: guanosine monophosphate reductase [Anaerolineales bacterium]|nr:guanosine monophosphate reductase [Anaerolineales bacterium]
MKIFKKEEQITFEDVLLEPQISGIRSRKDVSIATYLTNLTLSIPIIVAPMDTIMGPKMANFIGDKGGLGIVHRYLSIEQQVQQIKEISCSIKAGAVGSTGDFFERAQNLVDNGVSVLCVDVAHGHHLSVAEAVSKLKKTFPKVHIIAGNVATAEGYDFLRNAGADSVRVGIGPSSVCTTRVQTGHGIPQLSAILEIAQIKRPETGLIADGGIKTSGDAVKALAAGADCLMMGSFFAGTDETPGEIIENDGRFFKQFRGMASREAQEDWKGSSKSLEGVATEVKYRGSAEPILNDFLVNLTSGFSYSGARNLMSLQRNAVLVRVSHSSYKEGTPYVLEKK